MGWVFTAFLIVSILHMGEEYLYPGGFMDFTKRLNPGIAEYITIRFAVIINALQIVLCLVALAVWKTALVFAMSVAGLLFFNGLVHLAAGIRTKGYVPGVGTGVLLYLPISLYAYVSFCMLGQLSLAGVIASALLGILYHGIPVGYLALSKVLRVI